MMSQLRGALKPPTAPEVDIVVVPELSVCQPVVDLRGLNIQDISTSGAWSRLLEPKHIEESLVRGLLDGKTGGEGAPDWHAGAGGAPMLGVHICRVRDAYYTPEFGAVITKRGEVLHSSVAEALYFSPSLAALPSVRCDGDSVKLPLPESMVKLNSAAVFLPWGGRFNYGHFLLDSLPALEALREVGLLSSHTAIAPLMVHWQRDLLKLYLGNDAPAVVELDESIVSVGDIVFASPMDHFLHAPNRLLTKVRDRILNNVVAPNSTKRRIYLSRRNDPKRHLINELELEAALVLRGFEVIQPEDYSISAQVAIFRGADVVVAPTGAALANGIFCRKRTKIFEIQPTNFVGIWVRGFCHLLDIDWFGYFAPAPATEKLVSIENEPRPGTLFSWVLPLDSFLAFLDSKLTQEC